jgi:hypothetical protein
MAHRGGEPRFLEPFLDACDDDATLPSLPPSGPGSVRRIGRLRVPITLHCRPWATAYRQPDGRVLWCLRLWSVDRAVTRVVGTPTLRSYLRQARLPAALAELEAIVRAAPRVRGDAGA